MGRLVLGSLMAVALGTGAAAAAGGAATPAVTDLRVGTTGARPASDHRLLVTITPNGDGHRDAAVIRFRLARAATVRLEVRQGGKERRLVHAATRRLGAGRHRLVWAPPATTPVGTYTVEVRAGLGGTIARRLTNAGSAVATASLGVVRVRGVDVAFARASYAPGEVALLTVATDARRLTLQVLEVGPERRRTHRNDELNGVEVGDPIVLHWSGPRDRTRRVRLRVGPWRSGLYVARLTADDGRVGYAPFVVRPARPGQHRVAVVLPTLTWQAYNFWDADGNGVGDTWYADWRHPTVRLGRPFLNRGVPSRFRRYDLPFLHWLHWNGRRADFLADEDLPRWSGRRLADAYDLIVFPGHNEYVPKGLYDVVERYRDLGGNLMFLAANNFFWKVVRRGPVVERTALWRTLGRPEARLLGVQYLANDKGQRRRPFVVRRAPASAWVFARTGLGPGDGFGAFGIEIDAKTPASPPRTQVLAEIPHLFGRGKTAQMTYYETRRGAKVFSAGVLDFSAWALIRPVSTILENLWAELAGEEPEPAAAGAAGRPPSLSPTVLRGVR